MEISSTGILHLNNAYVYYGNRLDLNGLFSFSDLSKDTVSFQKKIMFQPAGILKYVEDLKPRPNTEIGQKDFFEIASSGGAFLLDNAGRYP